MMSPKEIVNSGLCIGCGVCVSQINSRSEIKMDFDAYGQLKPIKTFKGYRQSSEIFSRICPFSPLAKNEDLLSAELFPDAKKKHASLGKYISNYIGYVNEEDFRSKGSSGGMTTWIAIELMKKGLIDGVAHVIPNRQSPSGKKFFYYTISRKEEEIREGAKSRYYPVELSEVLKTISKIPGRYAVIGVPCMIKAIQLLRQENPLYRERICFTLGLICGHMKSTKFLESIARQMNVPLKKIIQVDFRNKIPNRPANWYNSLIKWNNGKIVTKDWWHMVDGDWGAGFFMNSACNFCDDVVAETADISFGDAWIEPFSSDGRGTNVLTVRSALIEKIVSEGINGNRLNLMEVSPGTVEKTQASGLRQRREGLAYRLSWAVTEIKPLKRISPGADNLPRRRKWVYFTRYMISKWSHRIFWLSTKTHLPQIYLLWARIMATFYYSILNYNAKIDIIKKRFSALKRF